MSGLVRVTGGTHFPDKIEDDQSSSTSSASDEAGTVRLTGGTHFPESGEEDRSSLTLATSEEADATTPAAPSGEPGEPLSDQLILDDLIVDGSFPDAAANGDETTKTTVRGVQILKTNVSDEALEQETSVPNDSNEEDSGAESMDGFLFVPVSDAAGEEATIDFASGLAPLDSGEASAVTLFADHSGSEGAFGSDPADDTFAMATLDGVF